MIVVDEIDITSLIGASLVYAAEVVVAVSLANVKIAGVTVVILLVDVIEGVGVVSLVNAPVDSIEAVGTPNTSVLQTLASYIGSYS